MSLLKNCFIVLISLVFIQCGKKNEFLIEKGNVGSLNRQTTILELRTIFENDSIASNSPEEIESSDDKIFSLDKEEYVIFSKEGKKILEIVPSNQNDSLSKIRSIQIFDSRYLTEKGISLKSTFKDINENYIIDKVETTLTSATLFIDELNATISIDKKELGLSTFSREEVSVDQIPDIAKIKYFTVWFN